MDPATSVEERFFGEGLGETAGEEANRELRLLLARLADSQRAVKAVEQRIDAALEHRRSTPPGGMERVPRFNRG